MSPPGNGERRPATGRPSRHKGGPAASRVSGPCPDCGTRAVGRHLQHAATCPLGRAAEARMAADRAWFIAHPGAQRYVRPLQPDEIAEMRLAGVVPDGWGAAGTVEVAQLRPGFAPGGSITVGCSHYGRAPRERSRISGPRSVR